MKKRIWIPILIFLLLAAFELVMEHRYSTTVVVPDNVADEEILAEMPEIAVLEEDHALEAYVLALPQVQEMLVRTGDDAADVETIAQADLVPMLSGWTQADWSASELCVTMGKVYVTFREDSGESQCLYTFFPNGESPMTKTIGLSPDGDTRNCTVLYENRGGELAKYVARHQWFSWIKFVTGRN